MKNIRLEHIVSCFLLCLLSIFFEINEVQAKNNDILPFNSFYGSWERRHLQELRDNQLRRREPSDNIEEEEAEFPTFRRRRQKKNKKNSENSKKILPKNSAKLSEKKKNRKKLKKHKSNKRFVKTTLKNVDIDSRMSNSIDSDKKNKPVDIIVHIKMNEK